MSTQLPPKRMRLGTHSCAECRKRKIRCVFPESSTACQSCLLHQVECKAQQPWTSKRAGRTRTAGEPASSRSDTAARLSEMESMVQRICDAIGLPRSQAVQTTPTTATTAGLPAAASHESAEGTEDADGSADAQDDGAMRDGPLMSLLREALLARGSRAGQPASAGASRLGSASDEHLQWQLRVRAVTSLLPALDGLRAVLERTRPFWDMWLPYHFGPDASDTLQQASISTALAVISAGWSADDPVAKAKARAWLALCLTQLPRRWWTEQQQQQQQQHAGALPPQPRRSLVCSYLAAAQELLFLAASSSLGGDSLEALEASAYLMRAHVDLGRPRKAWATARQAISSAQLLGLHRERGSASSESSGSPSRRRDLWDSIWQLERMHSMGLGLPTAISDADIRADGDAGTGGSAVSSPSSPSPAKRLRHRLSVIAGAIVQRDQAHANGAAAPPLDASVLAAWEAARELCPPGFWAAGPPPGLRLGELYERQAAQVYYFSVGKMLHLPALIAGDEPGSSACLAASRGVVRALLGLRGFRDEASGVESVFCESADFQGFTAGMVLAVGMLRRRPHRAASDVADAALLEELRDVLLEAADALDCSVARQGGEVLQLVLRALSGTADDREYDVVVPYFGRLRIRFPRPPVPDGREDGGQPLGWGEACASLDFDPSFFECGIDACFDLDAELAAPWAQ